MSVMDVRPRQLDAGGVEMLQWLSANVMDILKAGATPSIGLAEEAEAYNAAPQPAPVRSWLGVRTEQALHPSGAGQSGLVLLSVARASPSYQH